MYAGDRTKSTAPIKMVSGRAPRDLSGSKAARENPRCSVGESVYLLSHF